MPVAPTYPGVYIEEIPSGVHTLTGVSTSITAFIGFTARGNVDEPVHIFSFADFERAFGGLAVDSLLSYAVRDFFQNGGGEAYVIRVAAGAAPARVTVQRDVGGTAVLDVTAASAGTWGNNLLLDVDYATSNPASLFNLSVTELVERNGEMVPGRTEVFRNLSMSSEAPGYVIDAVASGSQLVSVGLAAPITIAAGAGGTSQSRPFATTETITIDARKRRLGVSVNGRPPFEIMLSPAGGPAAATLLDQIATDIRNAINAVAGGGTVDFVPATTAVNAITIRSASTGPSSSVHFYNASQENAAGELRLGLANGGIEADAVAPFRPEQTGTVGAAVTSIPTTAAGAIRIEVLRGASATVLATATVPVWGATANRPTPTSLAQVASQLNEGLADAVATASASAASNAAAAATARYLAGASAQQIGDRLRILPGPGDPNILFDVKDVSTADTTATSLGFGTGMVRNVARYSPGRGLTAGAQAAGALGNDGAAPTAAELTGKELQKTGIYALEDVDLFNLLVMPDATVGKGMTTVLSEAIAYCQRRRAFMIIDVPDAVATFAQAQAWMGSDASPLRSRNSALYFPRLRAPDPQANGVLRNFPAAGALAGLYARTDSDRGVWKAPAGTAATIAGATGLSYALSDNEHGTLNPLGLNCVRTFPVYGTVSWGARTGRGADALADEYKYVPVRRLALFLEESLFRGTKWAVFEPNDEPLWAQIRLNLGAFMHTLFARGAFQGTTPRDAYFVKCDNETTTQNDIDLGRVNIVVGFAPLKPAEFVVIQIQQIAGAIQT